MRKSKSTTVSEMELSPPFFCDLARARGTMDNTQTFQVDCHSSLTNALRRAVLGRVGGIAIYSITISHNTTVFWDEYIAHRMGMVPIRPTSGFDACVAEVHAATIASSQQRTCHFPSIGSMSLDVENTTNSIQLVTAGQMKSDAFEPIHPDTPIVYLSPNTKLHFVAHVHASVGRSHSRFCPALCSMDSGSLTIESHGFMSPKDILSESLDAVETELELVVGRDLS